MKINLNVATYQASILTLCLSVFGLSEASSQETATLRPPSVPLVACDPYFSVWSPSDNLADAGTVHWTGTPQALSGLVRIDGKAFRIMGTEPVDVPAMPQTGLEVLPTRTIYTFAAEGVRLTLTFMTAALPEDLMVYSRPVTYLTLEVSSGDEKWHRVQAYFDASAALAVNTPDQTVDWSTASENGLRILRVGSTEQPVLRKKGDNLRIDWGYLYMEGQKGQVQQASVATGPTGRGQFAREGTLPTSLVGGVPRKVSELAPVLAMSMDFGKISAKRVSRHLVLAYDDEYSIQYFKKNLRPYWRRNGDDAEALLKKAEADYDSLKGRCAQFDRNLMQTLRAEGGERYAKLCALAYRQCYAANKVVADANGQPLMFPKENFSNGCIGTVDVIYPMAPQFLLLSPSLCKAMLVPLLDYAASSRWPWPFAPHDLGTYPQANGQVYGGGERSERNQMPVEESGNMLIMMAALAQAEGNADFCAKYWPTLQKWADYLRAKGFDPENQLCTDDFAGHLAHNVNLSAKAICALGAYAELCRMRGDNTTADETVAQAREFAARWVREADDGDHFRLAFDKPGTWSQKYNLVWDRILGLKVFPSEVAKKEMAFYKTKLNTYGLPLDSRKTYTKLDWTLWTATLTEERGDFEALVSPVWKFLNETPDRVPMTDWYDTVTGKKVGFQARSVVGGVFLRVLYDEREWRRWAGRDKTRAAGWAPLPTPPELIDVAPTSEKAPQVWSFTTQQPEGDWFKPDYEADSWKQGPGGFGTRATPGAVVRTEWNTKDIWLRRQFTLSTTNYGDLELKAHHDEDAEVYIDGILAARLSGFITDYSTFPIRAQARAALKSGVNTIAVHCKQTGGGQYIDVGLVEEKER